MRTLAALGFRPPRIRASLGVVLPFLLLIGSVPSTVASPQDTVVVAAAGDIACALFGQDSPAELGRASACHEMETSDLLLQTDGLAAVLTLGDNQYPNGSVKDFQTSYDRSWGRLKSITHPSMGNHEGDGAGYYAYFGDAAGPSGRGYYSFDVGAWHVIALNSNDRCRIVVCDRQSAQVAWLKDDLARHPRRCTLAYWHHPRFSSGKHGDDDTMGPIWEVLYTSGVDLVLTGHDHDYERLAPLDAVGRLDRARGIRSFIVGTGGKTHFAFSQAKPTSEARNSDTFGILKLTLHPTSYEWEFVPEAGKTFTDQGMGQCH